MTTKARFSDNTIAKRHESTDRLSTDDVSRRKPQNRIDEDWVHPLKMVAACLLWFAFPVTLIIIMANSFLSSYK